MKSLEKMTDRPQFIFLENVKGFFQSEAHVQWTETLARCGYSWRQYLLTPFHFRVPNNRMRFYMVIKRDSEPVVGCPSRGSAGDKEEEIVGCGVHRSSNTDLHCNDGFSKDKSIVYNDIRPCECDCTRTSTINGKSLDTTFLHLDSSLLHKLHEMGEDDITGPPGVNDISQYLVRREDIGQSMIMIEYLGCVSKLCFK
jgi:site-specific DNA-cytosine methylase